MEIMKIYTKLVILFSILITSSITATAYFAFQYIEVSIIDSKLEKMDTTMNELRTRILAVASFGIAAGVVAVFGVASGISGPIKSLAEACRKQKVGKLERISIKTNDEISDVIDSMNSLIEKVSEKEKKLEQTNIRIKEINKELLLKDRLKDEFLSIASHELRNPVQVITGLTELVRKGHVAQDTAWNRISICGERLQLLTSEILEVSNIESGNLECVMHNIGLNDIILDVVNWAKMNPHGDVSIETVLDKDVEIFADKDRINQALTNIIGNSLKFTQTGCIAVESHVLADQNKVEIKISDTGPGIPNDIIPNLFGKFVTKNVGNTNKHGSGLGLFISKAIVSAHKGEISGFNNEGGATFKIVLPASEQIEKIVMTH